MAVGYISPSPMIAANEIVGIKLPLLEGGISPLVDVLVSLKIKCHEP
jgi:hypothetical protein